MSPRFHFTVIGKYESERKHEPQITANVGAGSNDHFVHAGTLTMSVSEWAALIDALLRVIPESVEIEDARHLIIEPVVSEKEAKRSA
ncbi:MAG: hypothetical protein ACJ77A_12625 [Actinomycetota bacterium]